MDFPMPDGIRIPMNSTGFDLRGCTATRQDAAQPCSIRFEVRLVFISVDVEASGTLPGFFDLLSIGAVPVVREGGEYGVGSSEFYVELKPQTGNFDPASMQVNGLDLARLEATGVPLPEAAAQFARFVKSCGPRNDPPVFVGYCANFDWAFVNDMFKRAKIENPFGYKALDLKSLAYGLFEHDWKRLGQLRLLELLGQPPMGPGEAHHALADARHQARMFVGLLARRSRLHRGE